MVTGRVCLLTHLLQRWSYNEILLVTHRRSCSGLFNPSNFSFRLPFSVDLVVPTDQSSFSQYEHVQFTKSNNVRFDSLRLHPHSHLQNAWYEIHPS